MQNFVADFAMLLLCLISALLILVVLLQRGRGGGLAGAFGGLGGQSAFGTKAGDVFTKITIGLVTAWVLLAGISGVLARKASSKFVDDAAEVTTDDDTVSSAGAGAGTENAGDDTSDDPGVGDGASKDGAAGEPFDAIGSGSVDEKAATPTEANSTKGIGTDPKESSTEEPKSPTPDDTDKAPAATDENADAEQPAKTETPDSDSSATPDSSTPVEKPTTDDKE